MKKDERILKNPLPETVLAMLGNPSCRKYILFENGDLFLVPSLTAPDGRSLALALAEERTKAGRDLVDALWFSRPVRVVLEEGGRQAAYRMEVYRCHIAGALFQKKLLEMRSEHPDNDMASAWELRLCGPAASAEAKLTPEEAARLTEAALPDRAALPEWHLDHPALHT